MNPFKRLFRTTNAKRKERIRKEIMKRVNDNFLHKEPVVYADGHELVVRTATASLRLFFVDHPDDPERYVPRLTVVARLVRVPSTEVPRFYRALLEENDEPLLSGRLALDGDVVLLEASVDVDCLNPGTGASDLVWTLLTEAGILTDRLQDEFGAGCYDDEEEDRD